MMFTRKVVLGCVIFAGLCALDPCPAAAPHPRRVVIGQGRRLNAEEHDALMLAATTVVASELERIERGVYKLSKKLLTVDEKAHTDMRKYGRIKKKRWTALEQIIASLHVLRSSAGTSEALERIDNVLKNAGQERTTLFYLSSGYRI